MPIYSIEEQDDDELEREVWFWGLSEEEGGGEGPRTQQNIVGTPGDDDLYGTEENDRIECRAGNDRAFGLGGDDVILGEEGDDALFGDGHTGPQGNDILYGGDGNDHLNGGGGNDSLYGGAGNDTLVAEEGEDYLDGGSGEDVLYGSQQNNELRGGAGRDVLYGGVIYAGDPLGSGYDVFMYPSFFRPMLADGNDEADGGDDNDTIYAMEGDDTIVGGGGDDVLHGQSGADLIYGDGSAPALDDGHDLLIGDEFRQVFAGWYEPWEARWEQGLRELWDYFLGGAGPGTTDAVIGDDGLVDPRGPFTRDMLGNQNDTLHGGGGNDTLRGGIGDDILYGGDGNDVLNPEQGSNTVFGGAGNDVSNRNLELLEEIFFGNNNFYSPGSSLLRISSIRDTYDMGAGDDRINFYSENPDQLTLLGYIGSPLESQFSTSFAADCGEGNDVVEATVYGPGMTRIDGGDGNDAIYLGGFAHVHPVLSSDTLVPRTQIDGGSGDDILDCRGPLLMPYMFYSDDSLTGGAGSDRIYGGLGRDTIRGGDGGDYLEASMVEPGWIFDYGSGLWRTEPKINPDLLYGGAGSDIFRVHPGHRDLPGQYTQVMDFSREEGDRMMLKDWFLDFQIVDDYTNVGSEWGKLYLLQIGAQSFRPYLNNMNYGDVHVVDDTVMTIYDFTY